MKEQKQRRKVTQACESCRKKRVKCTGEKPSCQKCRDANIECHYKPITKKRGPRSGFLDDMVNSRVKRILLDSHIPYNTDQGNSMYQNKSSDNKSFSQIKKEKTFILLDDQGKPIENVNSLKSDSDSVKEKANFWKGYDTTSTIKTSSTESTTSLESESNLNKTIKELWPQSSQYDTPNILENGKSHNTTKAAPFSFNNIVSLDDLTRKAIPINFQYTEMDEVKSPDQLLIEFKSQTLPNTVHIDYNLLTDYFNYAHAYNPIVHPTLLVRRIQQRILSPGLLLAIYAMTYLLRPSSNMKLAKFYASKARQYFLAHINTSDIQNIHTCYLLANFEPGTNRSYLFSGIAVRLLKVLNLYDEPNDNLDPIAYEEQIKTLWCCLSKDTLMNISSNRMEHPGWLDQPLPQEITDSAMLQYYTPKRLTIIFMAIVMCLVKIIEHSRNRRKGIYNIEEFHRLDGELLNLRKHIEKHISLSKKSFSKNTYPQLACIVYVYITYFVSKIILYNLELSPFIYKTTILKAKVRQYVQMNNVKNKINDLIGDETYININHEKKYYTNNHNTTTTTPTSTPHPFNNINNNTNNNNNNNLNNEFINNHHHMNNMSNGNSSNSSSFNHNMKNYHNNCILSKIPSSSSNYILVNKENETNYFGPESQQSQQPPQPTHIPLNQQTMPQAHSPQQSQPPSPLQSQLLQQQPPSLSQTYPIPTTTPSPTSVPSPAPSTASSSPYLQQQTPTSQPQSQTQPQPQHQVPPPTPKPKTNGKILEIPDFPMNFDYESCYKKCYESAQEATNTMNLLVKTIHKPYIRYQNPLCWAFYHIGLFYMTIYVNMKRVDVKETIDFYHEQIKSMIEYYPYLGRHYSKLYEDARNEAEIAFNNNDILFCPKGYY